LFCIIAVCVFTLYANQNFHENFELARTTLKATIHKTVNVTTDLRDSFIQLEILRNTTDLYSVELQLDALVDSQVQLLNATGQLIVDVGRFNKVRYLALCVILALCLLVPILTAFSGLTCCKGFSLFGFKVASYCLVLVWIGFAVHYPAAVLTSDFCVSVDKYVVAWNQTQSGGTSSDNSTGSFAAVKSVMDIVLRCQQDGAVLNFQSVFDDSTKQLMGGINYVVTSSDPIGRNWNYQLNNYSVSINQPFIQNNATAKAQLAPLISLTDSYVTLDNKFIPLMNCEFVASAFQTIRDSACVQGLSSMDILWSGFLILGIIMIPAAWVGITGYKWYRKRKFDKPQPKTKGGVQIEMVMLNGRQIPLETSEVH
jgi:hypothetical protein